MVDVKTEDVKASYDPNDLNVPGSRFLWFDDLGTKNPYSFLSNFYIGEPIQTGVGYDFMTGEHMFAAYKASTLAEFEAVMHAPDPSRAKELGRTLQLRADWDRVRFDVMAAVLRVKFTSEREEGQKLLNTGDAYLCEGTFWHDEVWGVDLTSPVEADQRPESLRQDYIGRNWLGTLLMARRAELRAEKAGVRIFDTVLDNLQVARGGDFLKADASE